MARPYGPMATRHARPTGPHESPAFAHPIVPRTRCIPPAMDARACPTVMAQSPPTERTPSSPIRLDTTVASVDRRRPRNPQHPVTHDPGRKRKAGQQSTHCQRSSLGIPVCIGIILQARGSVRMLEQTLLVCFQHFGEASAKALFNVAGGRFGGRSNLAKRSSVERFN